LDKPYIIWTLRRTGGTTLATLFGHASSHRKMQHEPFNPDRIHGNIVQKWNANFDVEEMRRNVAEILEDQPVIKHCYEVVPLQLNVILMQETITRGYEQIVLRRRAEVNRMFSLEVAGFTGAWGPKQASTIFAEIRNGQLPAPVLPIEKSVAHMSDCHLRSTWLVAALKSRKVDYTELIFEDLFSDPILGQASVNTMLRRLDHSEQSITKLQDSIQRTLMTGDQKTGQIGDIIEKSADWRAIMQQAWESLQGINTLNK
jgi:hypothetical protein